VCKGTRVLCLQMCIPVAADGDVAQRVCKGTRVLCLQMCIPVAADGDVLR
jgi:hypothetical protein